MLFLKTFSWELIFQLRQVILHKIKKGNLYLTENR